MATGTIKFYNRRKAYGFLTVEGEPDIFIHKTTYCGGESDPPSGNLTGRRVEYEPAEKSDRGPAAKTWVLN